MLEASVFMLSWPFFMLPRLLLLLHGPGGFWVPLSWGFGHIEPGLTCFYVGRNASHCESDFLYAFAFELMVQGPGGTAVGTAPH